MSTEDDLWLDGDPFDNDPASEVSRTLPQPAKGYIACPLAWVARLRPVLSTFDQLVVAQLLYRQCLIRRRRTVALSNRELAELGISRFTKYRTLRVLKAAGVVTIETPNGRSTRVTLHWFP